MTQQDAFTLEALVDFPDDALVMEITAAHIDAMMRRLAECGVRRVSWGYYADGRGGFLTPAHDPQFENLARTYQGLGQNPLAVAVQAAHRHGLEIYAYYKPYETGPAALFPEGSYEATVYGRLNHIGGRMTWVDPFVVDHPHLRIKRRSDDLARSGTCSDQHHQTAQGRRVADAHHTRASADLGQRSELPLPAARHPLYAHGEHRALPAGCV